MNNQTNATNLTTSTIPVEPNIIVDDPSSTITDPTITDPSSDETEYSPIYKLLLKIHKYALIFINKIVDILLLPKQLLLIHSSPFIKNSLITILFLIICTIIYSGLYSLLNQEDPINKCPQNASQLPENSYIYDQILEFYTQTCIIFNITPPSIPVPTKKTQVATLSPEQITKQATAHATKKLQRAQNTKMVIVQILGWILLIYLVIIISNPTNSENKDINSTSILTTFFR